MVQLIDILGKESIIKILFFFIENSSKEFSQTEVRKKTKIAKATAVKWLDFLEKNDFLNLKRIGVSKLYRLNNENLIIKQLKILKTLTDIQELQFLEDYELYLYGSGARGEDSEHSDIDLLIIGKKKNEIIENIDKLSKKLNKKINYKIFTQIEWSKMSKLDPAYYERVEKDKLRIV